MDNNVDIRKMNLNGCNESIRKEILAMHDDYLETGDTSREFCPNKKKKGYIIRYLTINTKLLIRKYKK